MRILHIGKYFLPQKGGMETYLADLVAAQHKQGLDATVIVHGERQADDPSWLMRVPDYGRLLYAPIAPTFRAALRDAIRRFRPDVLHLHMPNTSAFWVLTLPAAKDIPWIVHWHSDVVASTIRPALALAYRIYRPFEQALLAHARFIVATSPPYLEESEALRRWHDKTAVVPLGLDLERVLETVPASEMPGWSEGAFRLLSIGRLTYYKGFETLIEAVSALPNVELVIVGDGELRHALEKLIARNTPRGAAPKVRLLGAATDELKCALLRECDVFCLASCERTEAFGLVLLEAMAFGKPCLVSDLPGSGMPWLVAGAGAGALVPVGDVSEWRDSILRLWHDQAHRRLLGEAGRATLNTSFTAAASARALLDLYQACEPGGVPSNDDDRILVVIPAKDEAATIGSVVRGVMDAGWAEVLVVDDQSTDATSNLAREAGATVLQPALALGAWGATQTGIRYALRNGYGRVVSFDADGQHEPAYIAALVEKSSSHHVVIGAFPERGSPLRKIAWAYFRLVTGFNIEDLTSGFRCYSHEACKILAGNEATLLDYQDLGVLLLMRRYGLSIAEVTVEMYPRSGGPSRIFTSWCRVARYMLESTLLCLARWHRRNQASR